MVEFSFCGVEPHAMFFDDARVVIFSESVVGAIDYVRV